MLYFLGFDNSLLSLGTITLATAGETDVVVNMSSGVSGTDQNSASSTLFWHYEHSNGSSKVRGVDPDQTTHVAEYSSTSYTAALQAALRAEATTQTWASPNDIDVTINTTTGIITIAFTATITVTFSAAAGRNLLGFSSSPQSGASSYVGDQTPKYIIDPTVDGASDCTPDYEPPGVASASVANDGQVYGISRTVSPIYRDWVQQYETKAKTLRVAAASTHPTTLQALFEHCRCDYAFVVADGGFNNSNDECFMLRDDGAHFDSASARATPGNDSQFNIPFRTIVLGEMVAP